MIAEQQFQQILRRSRQLSDANQSNAHDQWALFSTWWDDSPTLHKLADGLGASVQKVSKWARAGAIVAAGVFDRDCDQSQEFLVQLSYFPKEHWESVADIGVAAGLSPSDLKLMRHLQTAMQEVGLHWCPSCVHGNEERSRSGEEGHG